MTDDQNEKTFTAEELDAIRAEITNIQQAEGLSQNDVAKASGVAYGTLNLFMNNKYQGSNERVAGELRIWLTARAENRRQRSIVPKVPSFIMTKSAASFQEALRYAQLMPEISVIAGAAGIGKTTAADNYAGTNPNVWKATMDPTMASVNTMLNEVAAVLGVTEKSATKLPRAIGRRVQDSGGLIIIDEAQHLSPQALDMLRSLYDRYQIGVALVGNETVYARLEGEGRKAQFAQLFSRVGVRVTRTKPYQDDMCELIKAWGVTEKDEIAFLKSIALKAGALRTMTKCLQLASLLAAGKNETRASVHLKAAYSRLTTQPIAEAV